MFPVLIPGSSSKPFPISEGQGELMGGRITALKKFFCTIIFCALCLAYLCVLPVFLLKLFFLIAMQADFFSLWVAGVSRNILVFILIFSITVFILLENKIRVTGKILSVLMKIFRIEKSPSLSDYTHEECAAIMNNNGMNIDIVLKTDKAEALKSLFAVVSIFGVLTLFFLFLVRDFRVVYIALFFISILTALCLNFYFIEMCKTVKVANSGLDFYFNGKLKESRYWNDLSGLYIKSGNTLVLILNKKTHHKHVISNLDRESLELFRKFHTDLLLKLSSGE